MASVGLGKARDDLAERRLGEPLRNPAAKDAVAQSALAGDHQDGAAVFGEAAQQEGGEDAAGAALIEAVQVDGRGEIVTAALQPTAAARLDRLWRRRLAGGRRPGPRRGSLWSGQVGLRRGVRGGREPPSE